MSKTPKTPPKHIPTAINAASNPGQIGDQAKRLCAGIETGFWYQVEVLVFVRRAQSNSDSYCKETEVGQYIGQPLNLNKTYVMNYIYGQHLYVLAVYRGKAYLCDGVNHSLIAVELRANLARRLGMDEVTALRYDSQTGATHCTNSAVLIMIELLKLYKRKVDQLPRLIFVPRYMREKLVNRIHKKENRRLSPEALRSGVKDLALNWTAALPPQPK